MEQEKHILRRKLSEAESEGDIRAQELESDYNDLKSKMLAQVSKKLGIKEKMNKIIVFNRKHRFDKTKEKRIF